MTSRNSRKGHSFSNTESAVIAVILVFLAIDIFGNAFVSGPQRHIWPFGVLLWLTVKSVKVCKTISFMRRSVPGGSAANRGPIEREIPEICYLIYSLVLFLVIGASLLFDGSLWKWLRLILLGGYLLFSRWINRRQAAIVTSPEPDAASLYPDKLSIQPLAFQLKEAELWYGQMAGKGWILKGRGRFFSRFHPGAPQRLQYRIAMSRGTPYERQAESQQLETAGWTVAAAGGGLTVYVAEADLPNKLFPIDWEQQMGCARENKTRRLLIGIFGGAALIAWLCIGKPLSFAAATLLIQQPAVVISRCLLAVLCCLYLGLSPWGAARLQRSVAERKAMADGDMDGKEDGRNSKSGWLTVRVRTIAVFTAAFFILSSFYLGILNHREARTMGSDLEIITGPYCTPVEMETGKNSSVNKIEIHDSSFLGESWQYQQWLGSTLEMFTYQLRWERMKDLIVGVLMETEGGSREDWTPLNVEGFEQVFHRRDSSGVHKSDVAQEYIAIKGKLIWAFRLDIYDEETDEPTAKERNELIALEFLQKLRNIGEAASKKAQQLPQP